jgi:hypothetical protein
MNLNMPRPLVTEKAYPENEALVTVTLARGNEKKLSGEFLYERRVGRRGQYDVLASSCLLR